MPLKQFENQDATEQSTVDFFMGQFGAERGDEPAPKKREPEEEAPAEEHDQPAQDEPADQDHGEDDQSNPDADSDASPDNSVTGEEPDEPADQPVFWALNDEGEWVQTTEEEARAGQLRYQDYTKKTTELAEQRRREEEVIQQQKHEAKQLLDTALLHAQADLAKFAEVDIQRLDREDPYEAERVRAEYLKAAQKYQEVESLHKGLEEERQKHAQERAQKWAEEEAEKVRLVIPELGDEQKAPEYARTLANYGQRVGLTEAELASLVDHRQLLILDKARKYDELMSKRQAAKKPAKKESRTVSPGGGEAPAQPDPGKERLKAMRERGLSGRGTDELATDAFTDILRRERK